MVQGRLLAERKGKNGQAESVQVTPGSLIGCAAFLSSSRNRETVRASQTCTLAVFGPKELDALMVRTGKEVLERSSGMSCHVALDEGSLGHAAQTLLPNSSLATSALTCSNSSYPPSLICSVSH